MNTTKLPIRKTPKGWMLNVPASLSHTGKRRREFYPNKGEAELARDAIRERVKDFGRRAHTIDPALAQQAAEAAEMLAPYGKSLIEAAKWTVAALEQQRHSVTFATLWRHHEEEREAMSQKYRNTISEIGRKLNPVLGERLICDIRHDELRDLLAKSYPTPHGFNAALRTVAPAFEAAVKEGWASESPCKRIGKRNTGRHSIRFLSLNQVRKVLGSMKDFRNDPTKPKFQRVDARGALAAIVLMLFAGIRPGEVARLEWTDTDMEAGTVFISNKKAKVDRSRYIEMPETLQAWLKSIPAYERRGMIVPPNWTRVWQAVRREAKINDMTDALRHSFATYHLAAFNDVNTTRAIMGHETSDLLFTNYRGVVSRQDAEVFWKILPKGTGSEGIQAV